SGKRNSRRSAMVDLRLMVANLKFIFLICFQQETLADGIVPTNVNVLFSYPLFKIPLRNPASAEGRGSFERAFQTA
ncbi:MAG: hypothetical protein PUG38_06045, partial [Sutterellaceae bacterium]|nr:hypothetical protein [Sutterellaceae bacterium]MDY2868649.1 hypothetical protein [Mesosutterella sp.]